MMDYRSQLFVVVICNGVSNNYEQQVTMMALSKCDMIFLFIKSNHNDRSVLLYSSSELKSPYIFCYE